MNNSFNKAFTGVIALALIVIAVGRIPFFREKELSNLCREDYTMYLNQNDYSLKEKNAKISLIAKKTGLKAETNNVGNFCNSFYFNQRQILIRKNKKVAWNRLLKRLKGINTAVINSVDLISINQLNKDNNKENHERRNVIKSP